MSSRKAEQSEATRAALLSAARGLFTERGYADTPTEEIVQAAGVTRGALYHHFRDKEDLFRAVYEDVDQEMVRKIYAVVMEEADPWHRLHAGSQAFLDACMEPAVHRIVLLDAPSVLGWETWREIDARYGLGLVRQGAADGHGRGRHRAAADRTACAPVLGGAHGSGATPRPLVRA